MMSGDEDTGFAIGELEFHNVSEAPTFNQGDEIEEIFDPLTPDNTTVVKIQLSKVFLEAFESQGEYHFMFMPSKKEQGFALDFIGSVVC